ncbi:MAG: dienelactone hydrolase [Ramlibacter sp.]|nr:dienelactone hydrolase [Ramlibacter sp.]
MKKELLAFAVALLATLPALAGVGLAELPGAGTDGPVTLYYPSSAADQSVTRGPFTMQLAPQGPPVRGNGRLVVISHGSGGAPWVHSTLARVLVSEGFVVAMPEHKGDNYRDTGSPGPDSWKQRPAEVSRAIDAVAAAPRFAALLELDRVGMYGMSAGGHTALSLAGGRWSPRLFLKHCETHIKADFPACVGLFTRLTGGWLDGLKKNVAVAVLRQRFDDPTWQVHSDPRIRAIVAGVPAAADFDPESLAAPRVPLGLVTAGKDRWLSPRFHSEPILRACAPCERIAHLPDAGHGFLLSPPVPASVLGKTAGELLNDPPGFDRNVLPEVDRKIAAFFTRHLLP